MPLRDDLPPKACPGPTSLAPEPPKSLFDKNSTMPDIEQMK